MDKGTPNQELAAIVLRRALRDYVASIEAAMNTQDIRIGAKMIENATATAKDTLKQFDAIMGDELRVVENMNKINLPLNVL